MYQSGSLVSVRGRDWVVQPDSTKELLIVKPLDGNDDETTGILMALEGEQVKPATFEPPKPEQLGDARSCALLRDALRIGVRNSAGPFRSFGRIAVQPRPYQLVPLMMGLKLDPVRLLIADDVGIGKTIESCLLARELIDRGECRRLGVLCPPHLAEQWQRELFEKFHIDAKLVLSNTVKQLDAECLQSESIFDVFPYTVVSIDFIKSDRRREDFLRAAPDFVIVDEAHTASTDSGNSARHQRYELIRRLCDDPKRHVVLVTATPHSGNEGAFRSLLGLLDKEFLDYPADMSGEKNRRYRQKIAKHFIQRRRADILHFLEDKTEFPKPPKPEEQRYTLSEEYHKLFEHSLEYVRELVFDKKLKLHHQRVRWWSALALLRALASSPAAAAATLKNRSVAVDAATVEEVNDIGRKMVFDFDSLDSVDASDMILGSKIEETDGEMKIARTDAAILKELAAEAESLYGEKDKKMLQLAADLKKLLKEGFHPIVFCRFIQTAEYLAEQLRPRLKNVEVYDVTGQLPPEERQRRVQELAEHEKRVLVCTDCLSEGINLQEHFDAVIHYDLSWNPTRHEQREGRVDRFGQPKDTLRMITYYGADNQIDGVVLDVLLRKHKKIKDSLGISVPVPADTQALVEVIFSSLLRKKETTTTQQKFKEIEDYLDAEARHEIETLHEDWDEATRNEKRSRTVFAQNVLAKQVDEVRREYLDVQKALGSTRSVADFTFEVLKSGKATVKPVGSSFDPEASPVFEIDMQTALPRFKEYTSTLLQQRTAKNQKRLVRFALPVETGIDYLCRTHPLVEAFADYVLNSALDASVIAENSSEQVRPIASRCGLIYTPAVKKRTTLLLLRYRFHLVTQRRNREDYRILAEDVQVVGFRGAPDTAEWIENPDTIDMLLTTGQSSRNIIPKTAKDRIQEILDAYDDLLPTINRFAAKRAEELKDAHQRVREITSSAAGTKTGTVEVEPELPPDLLGIYVYLPE